MSSTEKIPEDLLLEFLSRIPTKYVVRSANVSRSWRDITNEEYFRNLHSARCLSLASHIASPPSPLFFTVFESEEFSVISMSLAQDHARTSGSKEHKPRIRQIIRKRSSSSYQDINETWETTAYKLSNTCNGLLCIKPSRDCKQSIEVCNPLTLEYTTVPPCSDVDLLCFSVGLGYSPSTREYKVVALTLNYEFRFYGSEEDDNVGGKLLVYTLGSDDEQWRYVQDINFYPREGPLYLQGRMYWIIYDGRSLAQTTKLRLVFFDLETEKFVEVESMPGLFEHQEVHLMDFEGAIAAIFVQISQIDIWVLMDNHWERRHRIKLPCLPVGREESFPRFIGLWERDHGVLQIWLHDVMLLYDERDDLEGNCTMYQEPDLSQKKLAWHLCTNYKPSFLSLKRLGCKTRETSLDRVWDMEVPPNCYPRWKVIDLEF